MSFDLQAEHRDLYCKPKHLESFQQIHTNLRLKTSNPSKSTQSSRPGCHPGPGSKSKLLRVPSGRDPDPRRTPRTFERSKVGDTSCRRPVSESTGDQVSLVQRKVHHPPHRTPSTGSMPRQFSSTTKKEVSEICVDTGVVLKTTAQSGASVRQAVAAVASC